MQRGFGVALGLAAWMLASGCGLSATITGIILVVTDNDEDDPNLPPTGSVLTPTPLVNDVVKITYTVVDPEADPVRVDVRYSTDGGTSFVATPATPATGLADHSGDTNLASSAVGVTHTFCWNTFVDLLAAGQADNFSNLVVRITITQMDGASSATIVSGPFDVWNRYTASVAGGESAVFSGAMAKPSGMVRDSVGNLVIADAAAHQVVRLDAQTGAITVVAGTGTAGFNGDNIPATQADLNSPYDVAVDPQDNVYVADRGNSLIRRIDATTGFITSVAGNGAFGYKLVDEGGNPVLVSLTGAEGIDVDASGNLWIADTGANRIRVVNRNSTTLTLTYWTGAATTTVNIAPNTIRTVAGGWIGLAEDINPLGALVSQPRRVRLVEINNIVEGFVIAETGLNRVRTVSLRSPVDGSSSTFFGTTIVNGQIRTVAGTLFYLGAPGTVGDGGPATSAKLSSPTGIDVFWDFLLAIADTGHNRVRFVGGGVINTAAGNGGFGFQGDGGVPQLALLSAPLDCKLDKSLNLFVADTFNSRIRMTNTGFWAGAFTPNTTDAWLSGGAGLTTRTDGTTFTQLPVGRPELLLGVHGTGPSDIVTVGIQGSIFRWDGTRWNAEASGTTQPLFDVHAVSTTAQWAVGAAGDVRFYNGTAWSQQISGVTTVLLADVWGPNASNVFAVGEQGTVRYFNGTSWAAESGIPVTTQSLNGIDGLSTTNIYVVGDAGTFWHKTGTGWTDLTASVPVTTDLQGVYAASASDVFIVGDNGVILHYNGSSITQLTSPTLTDLQAVHGTSASNVYAVGPSDTVVRYDGTNWIALGPDSSITYAGVVVKATTINSITQPPPRQVLAVVDPSACLVDSSGDVYFANSGTHRVMHLDQATRAITTVAGTGRAGYAGDGGTANGSTALTTADLRGVWGDTASNVWAAGLNGTLLRFNGTTWSTTSSPTTVDLHAIHGTSANDIWAVGAAGTAIRFDGTTWSAVASGTTRDLNAVFALTTTDVFIVGDGGTIRRWNGTAFADMTATMTNPPNTELRGIWASGASDAYAVGVGTGNPTQSTIWRWNGTTWATVTPPVGTTIGLSGVFGLSASQVWAVGDLGLLYFYNGTSWAAEAGAVGVNQLAVFGRTASDMFAVGDFGSLQRRGTPPWTTGTTLDDTLPESVGLRAGIAFGTAAFVVGDDGTIYQQSSSGSAWVLQHGLAQLSQPNALALSPSGQVLYVADADNNRVRAINVGTTSVTLFSGAAAITIPAGGIQTIAGGAIVAAFPNGDGGVATAAELLFPAGLAMDPTTGDLYIADAGHHRVRVVNATTGAITAVAGNGTPGYTGDAGLATAATCTNPFGVTFERINATTWNLYIADTGNHVVRLVDSATLNINTVAGTGVQGFDSDGKSPTTTQLNSPFHVLVVGSTYYVSDAGNSRLRRVSGSPPVVSTVCGTGAAGFAGDPKPPSNAQVNTPMGLARDAAKNVIYFADSGNGRIRRFRD